MTQCSIENFGYHLQRKAVGIQELFSTSPLPLVCKALALQSIAFALSLNDPLRNSTRVSAESASPLVMLLEPHGLILIEFRGMCIQTCISPNHSPPHGHEVSHPFLSVKLPKLSQAPTIETPRSLPLCTPVTLAQESFQTKAEPCCSEVGSRMRQWEANTVV